MFSDERRRARAKYCDEVQTKIIAHLNHMASMDTGGLNAREWATYIDAGVMRVREHCRDIFIAHQEGPVEEAED